MSKKIFSALLTLVAVFSFFIIAHKVEATTCTSSAACTGGTGSWVAPAGVTSVSAEVWGGGGGGAGDNANSNGGKASGGGGAYSKKINITVVPGNSYTVTIGSGGLAGIQAGVESGGTGGDSWFCNSTTNCATIGGTAVQSGAKGGVGGNSATNNSNAAGGALASGFGDTKFSGGTGGAGGANGTGSGGGGGLEEILQMGVMEVMEVLAQQEVQQVLEMMEEETEVLVLVRLV